MKMKIEQITNDSEGIKIMAIIRPPHFDENKVVGFETYETRDSLSKEEREEIEKWFSKNAQSMPFWNQFKNDCVLFDNLHLGEYEIR